MLIPPPQITSSGHHNLLPSVYVALQIWPSVAFSGLSHTILPLLVGYSCHPIGFKYIIAYVISVHSTRNNIWKPRKIQLEHVLRKSPKYVTTNSLNTIITWRVKQIPWICWVLTQNKMKKTFPTYETVCPKTDARPHWLNSRPGLKYLNLDVYTSHQWVENRSEKGNKHVRNSKHINLTDL